MKIEEFLKASLGQLAQQTGVDRFRWCKYFRGTISPTERTITKAAQKLGMTPAALLRGIQLRREINELSNKAS